MAVTANDVVLFTGPAYSRNLKMLITLLVTSVPTNSANHQCTAAGADDDDNVINDAIISHHLVDEAAGCDTVSICGLSPS